MPRKRTQKATFQKVQEPYKKREAELVALWLSMPFVMHQMPKEKVKAMGYDVEDDDFVKVLMCKTRTELATALNVGRSQIHKWEGEQWMKDRVAELNKESNVLRFKKDIDYNFTQRTLRSGTGNDIKVWYELFTGFKSSDPSQVNAEAMKAMAESIKRLAEKK